MVRFQTPFSQIPFEFIVNSELSTPIQWHTGHDKIVRLLVENGAEIDVVNTDNDTPLLLAVESGIFHFERPQKKWN